jgi:Zn-finger nucleic acid-binding protein
MECPKCGSELRKTSYRGIEVDRCSSCDGMWLDLHELDQLEDKAFDRD